MGGRGRHHSQEERAVVLALTEEATAAGARLEKVAAHLGLSTRTIQRWSDANGGEDQRRGANTEPANKLSEAEREKVIEIANSLEYRDLSPKQIVPRLADEGVYVASESTLYRVLREQDQMAHRERSRPARSRRPQEHVATGPNQVWVWDISYLPGPVRGTFFYLYLILDVWSRKIVGAEVYEEETSERASQLFVQTCWRLGVEPDGLVLHSDNGSPMKGSTMLATLQWLGVVPSFSRPRVSNDNAFAEASFRTLKYRPNYPSQPFASLEAAQAWVAGFVQWYNTEHRHSAIRYVTPDQRHYGQERTILEQRRRVYADAKARHPERWTRNTRDWTPVAEVRLNPGRQETKTKQAA